MKNLIINTSKIIFILAVMLGISPAPVLAQQMTSTNYTVESDSVNFAGTRSTSASYALEDTVGEVGTGDLSSASANVSAGYQQSDTASPSVSPSPGASPTPGGNTSGGSGTTTPYFPVNVINFSALAGETSILLDWMYPQGADITSVRIVRSDKFFPGDVNDGTIIFEGDSDQAIDHDVVPGVTYYYALFARDSKGNYSSGVLARARITPPGTTPETLGSPFDGIPQALDVHPSIASLTLADFEFIQDGRLIAHAGNQIVIDAKKNLTIRLDYKKVPEILKTIAISLADPEDKTKIFTFLLRVNKDKTAYEATISSLGRSGIYKLDAIVLDYGNQGLKRLNGNLRALVLDSVEGLLYQITSNKTLLYGMFFVLLMAFLLILWLIIHRKKQSKLGPAVVTTVLGLILYICMSIQPVFAAINKEINYQGKLADSAGTAVTDGLYTMVFNLYTVSSGGTAIWTETLSGANEVTVTDGLFSVLLGQVSTLAAVDFNQTLYLGVTIESDGEMTPRKKLGAVPAAFVADTLDGLDSSAFLQLNASGFSDGCLRTTSGVVTSAACGGGTGGGSWSTTTSQVAGQDVNYSNETDDIVAIGSTATTSAEYWFDPNTQRAFFSGRVGIGSTSPYAALSVVGQTVAAYFTATTTTASTFPYASTTALTTSNLFIGSLNGPLQANNGVVSATTSIGVLYGGTGLTSIASSSLILGNAAGGYTAYATSSLGIALSDTVGILGVTRGGTGLAAYTQGDLFYASGATTLAGTSTANLKISLALGNVENTALSTWVGSTNLTTLGTITTGTWNADTIAVNKGGTGLTSIASSSLLLGNISGGYTAYATSSLGILSSQWQTNGSNINFVGGNVGIGSTSPWATLAVNPVAGSASNQFVVGSSTATAFVINNSGNVAIGASTVTTNYKLDVRGSLYADGGIDGGSHFTLTNTSAALRLRSGNTNLSSPSTGMLYVSDSTFTGNGTLVAGNLGLGTTSPYQKLSVAGGNIHVGGIVISTSTTAASIFPYASTTALSATTICFDGDTCRTTWPTGGGASYDWQKETNYGATALTPTTTIAVWIKDQLYASSSAIIAGKVTANNFVATGTAASILPYASSTALTVSGTGYVGLLNQTSTTGTSTFASGVNISTANHGAALIIDALDNADYSNLLTVQSVYAQQVGMRIMASAPLAYTETSIEFGGYQQAVRNKIISKMDSSGNVSDMFFMYGNGVTKTGITMQGTNGNVGIGTTTAYGGAIEVSPLFAKFGIHANNGDTNTTLFAIGSSTATATTTLLSFMNTGKLGIGTTSPYAKLSINPIAGDGAAFAIGSSSASRFIVTNGGDIGIGKANPTAKLDLVTTGLVALAIDVSNTTNNTAFPITINRSGTNVQSGMNLTTAGTNRWFFGPDNDSTENYFAYNWSGNKSVYKLYDTTGDIGFSNSLDVYIQSAGNVGIGTTSPFANLAINPIAGRASNQFVVGSSTRTSFIINNSGNVGIGTTSPNQKLSVGGDILGNNIIGSYFTSTSTTASIFPYASTTALTIGTLDGPLQANNGFVSATTSIGVFYGGTGLTSIASSSILIGNVSGGYTAYATSSLGILSSQWTTNGSNIDYTTGFVGIGSTTPWGRLSINPVAGDGAAPAFVIGSSTATSFLVNNAGNVAIGASSVSTGYKLDVTGNQAVSGNIVVGANAILHSTGLYNGSVSNAGYVFTSGEDTLKFRTAAIGEVARMSSLGNFGIGTTSPYRTLSVHGSSDLGISALAGFFTATSTTATSTFAGGLSVGGGALEYDFSTGKTSIDNLSINALSFEADAGLVSWMDLPVTSAAPAGTPEGYAAFINGNPFLSLYSESNGVGGTRNHGVAIGTSTPYAALTVWATTSSATANAFEVVNTASTSLFTVKTNGNVGVGTSSPYRAFSVYGSSDLGINALAGYFTATSTTASVFPYASTTALTVSGTNGLTVGTLNGPLQANNGVVSATTSIGVLYGGTGLTSIASSSILVGNISGGYTAYATSSLGIISSQWTTNGTHIYSGNTGNVGIGSTTPWAKLAISGTAGQLNPFFAVASTSGGSPFFQIASTSNVQIDGGVVTPTHKGKILDGAGGASIGSANSVFVSGNYAYIANGGGVLEIVDISNPAAPVHKGKISNGDGGALLASAYSVFVSGNYAYVAATGGLEIVDISNPAAPVHKGKILDGAGGASLTGTVSVFVSGNYAYVADFTGGALEIVDVSNPAVPVHKGKILHAAGGASLLSPYSVFVSGNYAYVADNGGALEIVDISNPAAPVHKGKILAGAGGASLTNPISVFVSGNYAYVTDYGNALEIVDISNPTAPVHKGKILNGAGGASLLGANSVFVSGNYAYIADGDGVSAGALEIIDISNPAAPVHKGKILDGAGGASLVIPFSVFVSGNYAYVADNNGALEIVDVGALNVSNAQIGTLAVGNLSVSAFAQFSNDVLIKNSLAVGGNTLVNGVLTVTGANGTTTRTTATTSAVFMHNVQIGTPSTGSTTPYSRLTVFGQGTGTNGLFELVNNASTTVFKVFDNGNVGIGTTTPGSIFSIGSTVNFTAATTTFASTGGVNLDNGCFAVRGVCLASAVGSVNGGTIGQFAAYTTSGSVVDGSSLLSYNGTNVSVGTTTSYSRFSVWGLGTGTNQLFSLVNNASTTIFQALENGNIGLGTTSPYARLAVSGLVVADNFFATSTTATSTFAGGLNVGNGALQYDYSSGITSVDSIALGALSFDTNAGLVSWADLPVTSAAPAGTVQGYIAQINSNPILTLYSESDGVGGIKNISAAFGTSTPYAALTVWATTSSAFSNAFEVANTASTSLFTIKTNGNVGVGTTTPAATFAINPTAGNAANQFIVGSSTATALLINNSGNVSVGSALDPGVYKLNVRGADTGTTNWAFKVANSADTAYFRIRNDGYTEFNQSLQMAAGAGIASGSSGASLIFAGGGGSSGSVTLDTLAGTGSARHILLTPGGNVGISTSTPQWLLQVASTSANGNFRPQFALTDMAATTNQKHWTLASLGGNFYLGTSSDAFATSSIAALSILANSNVGIGTSTPYGKLSVAGLIVGSNFTADNASATSTFAGGLSVGNGNFQYDWNTGVTSIASAQFTNLNFDEDAGVVGWTNLPVTNAVSGLVQSYTASIDDNPLLTLYGISDGVGNVRNLGVGIGTTSPYARLTLWGTSTVATNRAFEVANSASTTLFTIFDNGNTGVGTTSPWSALSVSGTMNLSSTLTSGTTGNYLCINNTSYEVTTGTTCSASSERFKDNINSITYGLDAIVGLRPVSFTYKASADPDNRVRLGFIAEEVEDFLPELVNYDKDGVPESVDYAKLTPVLTKAIQELNAKVDALNLSSSTIDFAQVASTTAELLATSTSFIEKVVVAVQEKLQSATNWVFAKISATLAIFQNVESTTVTSSSITATSSLTVGSAEKASGITLYDKVTKQPYCLTLSNGSLIPSAGVCDEQVAPPPPAPSYSPSPAPSAPGAPVDPSPSPTPSTSPEPSPAPSTSPAPETTPPPADPGGAPEAPAPEAAPAPAPEPPPPAPAPEAPVAAAPPTE